MIVRFRSGKSRRALGWFGSTWFCNQQCCTFRSWCFWSCGLLIAAMLLNAPGRVMAQAKPPEGVAFEPNVECGKGGEQVLKLDLAYP